MDYPQLNLLFGLGLIFTLVANLSLRVLLSKVHLSRWMSSLSWVALIFNIVAAVYIEGLFLRSMTPAFNQQIGLGLLVIGGLGALITASLYQRVESARLASILFAAQMLVSLISLVIAFGLYRSLVPIAI
jgi:fluoride ion exporter CrcB/FEX